MDMNAKLLSSLTALSVAATVLPAGSALGADAGGTPTTVPSVKVTKAYAYVDTKIQPGTKYVHVVFKTKDELPRRYDGMIRASGALDQVGHSIGSVHGKASKCYGFYVKIVDGRIATKHGASAKIGSKHKLVVTARGDGGKDLSGVISVTLRKAKAGDASGKPLGC